MKNSERFTTAKERTEAFWKRYTGQMVPYDAVEAFATWLDLEAEAEKPLPCPFCGSHTVVEKGTGCFYIHCSSCNYESPAESRPIDVIAAHNRVARAAKEKEAKVATAHNLLSNLTAVCHVLCPDNDGYEDKCEKCNCRKLLLEMRDLERRIMTYRETIEKRAAAKEVSHEK